VVLRAAQFLRGYGLVFKLAELAQYGIHHLTQCLERGTGVDGEAAGVGVRVEFRENGVSEALFFANVLE
jgi:hypothetical protein